MEVGASETERPNPGSRSVVIAANNLKISLLDLGLRLVQYMHSAHISFPFSISIFTDVVAQLENQTDMFFVTAFFNLPTRQFQRHKDTTPHACLKLS